MCATQRLVRDTGVTFPQFSGVLSQGPASSHSLEGELTAQGPFLELLPIFNSMTPSPCFLVLWLES